MTCLLPSWLPLLRRGDRRRLPSHQAAADLLRCLLAACQLVEELAPAVHRASLQLLAQLAHSFFMPLCLTALAALARIQVRFAGCPARHLLSLLLAAQSLRCLMQLRNACCPACCSDARPHRLALLHALRRCLLGSCCWMQCGRTMAWLRWLPCCRWTRQHQQLQLLQMPRTVQQQQRRAQQQASRQAAEAAAK